MATSFKDLKKKSAETYTKLADNLKNENTYAKDERIWYPQTDKAGNGSAVIRFLPAPPGEDEPFVRIWSHSFKGPTGQWYIENSLTTLKQPDPCGEYNNRLWATEIEDNKEQARKQKRNTNYYANILVIKDPLNPENEGKVKLFRFGPMFFDMIKAKMVPEFDDQQAINVFDFWEGATFRIRIRTEGEYRKYDRSEFDQPAPLFDDDEKLEEIWQQEYSLQAFIDPKEFKPYEVLKARLDKVLGLNSGTENTTNNVPESKAAPEPEHKAAVVKEEAVDNSADADDEDLAFFKNLMEDE